MMNSLIEKLAMSGYGAYVWTSVFAVLGALIVLYLASRWRLKKALEVQVRLREQLQEQSEK